MAQGSFMVTWVVLFVDGGVFFNPDRCRLVLLANDDFERIKN